MYMYGHACFTPFCITLFKYCSGLAIRIKCFIILREYFIYDWFIYMVITFSILNIQKISCYHLHYFVKEFPFIISR